MKKLILIMLFVGSSVFASTNDAEAINKAKLSIASYNCYAFYNYLNKEKKLKKCLGLAINLVLIYLDTQNKSY